MRPPPPLPHRGAFGFGSPWGSRGPDAGLWSAAARGVRWAGTLLWAGAALWAAWPGTGALAPPLRERVEAGTLLVVRGGLTVAWVAGAGDLALQAAVAAGGDLTALGGVRVRCSLLAGSAGGRALLLELGFPPLLLGLWRRLPGPGARVAAVAEPQASSVALDAVHLLAAAAWVGGAAVVAWAVPPPGRRTRTPAPGGRCWSWCGASRRWPRPALTCCWSRASC